MENTLFSFFSLGWHECNSHYHIKREKGSEVYLLFFTIKGQGHLHTAGKHLLLLPNTIAIIPPGIDMEYYPDDGELWEFYWLHPGGNLCAGILDAICRKRGGLFTTDSMNSYTELLENLIFISLEPHTQNEIEISLLLSQLYHRLLAGTLPTARESEPEQALAGRIIRYFETHYREPVTLSSLSRDLFFSPAHLIRVFRAKTGYTPCEYLNKLRIIKACELLTGSSLPIAEIARLVGYKSSASLIVHFKAGKGMTPLAFRGKGY